MLVLSIHCIFNLAEAKVATKRVIKVSTISIPPFYMEDVNGGVKEQHGYIVDMLAEMAPIMNVTFDIKMVRDGRFGSKDKNGNWTGMIGEVISGHADVAAAPLTVHSMRMKHVDMTYPFLTTGLKIVIKKPNLTDINRGHFIILKPFSAPVWCFIVLAYMLTGGLLAIIGRLSPREWTNTAEVEVDDERRCSFNCVNSFLFVFSTFMWQGYRIAPRSYSGRTLSVFWWIFVLFTLVLYIGSMAAHLLANRPKNAFIPFTNFHDMIEQKEVAYGTIDMSSTLKYFKNSLVAYERLLYENMMADKSRLVKSVSEGLNKVRESNGKYAFIMEGSLAEYEASQQPCDLMVVGELSSRSYSFVTQKNSLLSNEMNMAIVHLQENNVIEKIHEKWMLGECHTSIFWEDFMDNQAYFDKIDIEQDIFGGLGVSLFAGPLIILFLGMICAGSLLAAEIFISGENIKRNRIGEDDRQLQGSFHDVN
ncbi:glutamate receptor 2-like [Argonauta hians]